MKKGREPLGYADPALNKPSKMKDLLLLSLIGTVFGISFLVAAHAAGMNPAPPKLWPPAHVSAPPIFRETPES